MDIYCIDMPKHAIDYQKAKIYKICCKDVDVTDCYVGSTTNMSRRKSTHKNVCNNERGKCYNLNVYRFIRDNGGWQNWDMVVVEDFPCDSKNQLHTRERHHMELLRATLNKYIPSRTRKEYKKAYRKDNTDHIKAYSKAYQQQNTDHIKAREKAYKSEKISCPHCNKILSRCSMTRHIRRKHTE